MTWGSQEKVNMFLSINSNIEEVGMNDFQRRRGDMGMGIQDTAPLQVE
jgi:hypothetical protein